jgi:ATP-binding cassette subfamily C (CFTR/MRP) protein 4
LLDDPLSAVDVHVGNRLFTECILKELKDKIVILVTHQLQYLSHADKILIMEEGKITHTGTYQSIKEQGLDIVDMLRKFGIQEHVLPDSAGNSSETAGGTELLSGNIFRAHSRWNLKRVARFLGIISTPTSPSLTLKHANATSKANKEQDEERELGSVAATVYKSYFFSQKTWWAFAALMVILYRAADLFQNYWLAYWSNTMSSTEGS